MLSRFGYGFVALIGAVVLVGSGCDSAPTRIVPPDIDAAASGQRAMEMFDKDGDGKIAGEELDAVPGLKAAINEVDTDGDKAITAAEITARIEGWQKSMLGRQEIDCTVLRDGVEVSGAEVTFVPEAFLGENLQEASGETDEFGVATMTVPVDPNDPNDAEGVECGFYRVEITRPGQDVAAKYNSETTLGQEVAWNADGILEGIKFHID